MNKLLLLGQSLLYSLIGVIGFLFVLRIATWIVFIIFPEMSI